MPFSAIAVTLRSKILCEGSRMEEGTNEESWCLLTMVGLRINSGIRRVFAQLVIAISFAR